MDGATYVIGLVTTPVDRGAEIARLIVEQELAACVNILPAVTSIFRWAGRVEESAESLLIVKTTAVAVSALNQALRAVHPYAVFELVVFDITDGNTPYLAWIGESVNPLPPAG